MRDRADNLWLAFFALLICTALTGWAPPQLDLMGDTTRDGDPPQDTGAVTALYLRFDNDGGSAGINALVVADEGSPVANHGTAVGGPLYIADSFGSPIPQTGDANNLALSLDPTLGQYISVAYHPSISFAGGSFTIEAWVRLDELATGMTPQDRAWLAVKKEPNEGDGTIEYAFLVQTGAAALCSNAFGKTSGLTGNELGVILGDAVETGQWALISHLEITDTAWHYVSVSLDTENEQARFVLDEQVDLFDFVDQGHTFNQGQLVIGAHPNAAGSYETPLAGDMDEFRISRGVVPEELLLDRWGDGPDEAGWTLDFGTVELGSAPVERSFHLGNAGEEDCYSMEGMVDLSGVNDPRLAVTDVAFEGLGWNEISDTVTVTFDPVSVGELVEQQLLVTATATTYGFHALGSPATVSIMGTVEDPAADDDDDDTTADDDTGEDEDAPEYAEGCGCTAATAPPKAWAAVALLLLALLHRKVRSR